MIFAPMMPDRLAAQCGLAPVSAMQDRWRRDALLLLGQLNELKVGDIYIQCGFVGDQIAIASMRRWQPDMKIMAVDKFNKDASEAIQYLRSIRRTEAPPA